MLETEGLACLAEVMRFVVGLNLLFHRFCDPVTTDVEVVSLYLVFRELLG